MCMNTVANNVISQVFNDEKKYLHCRLDVNWVFPKKIEAKYLEISLMKGRYCSNRIDTLIIP